MGSQRGSVAVRGSASPSCGTSSIADLMLQLECVVKKTERFTTECLDGLRRAQALRPQIIEKSARTIDEALVHYNELLTAASASNALAGLMSEVHPDELIRDAARECEQAVSKFYSE